MDGTNDLGEDLLKGADAIAAHLGAHFTRRSIYHLVEAGQLPVVRKGRTIYARKSELALAFTSPAAER